MRTIYTHESPDLDALASVWAAFTFIPNLKPADTTIAFVSANWDGGDLGEDDLALDIDAGGKGIKGRKDEDGSVHSCFALLLQEYASPEDREALELLTAFIDAHDAHGDVVGHFAPQISGFDAAVLRAGGISTLLRAFQNALGDDHVVHERISEIFSGILRIGRSSKHALSTAGDSVDIDRYAADWAMAVFADKEDDAPDPGCGRGESRFVHILRTHASRNDQEALKRMMVYVEAQCSHGNAVDYLARHISGHVRDIFKVASLNTVLAALRCIHEDDAVVLERMGEIFSGVLEMGRSRHRATTEARIMQRFGPNGEVALMVGAKERATRGALYRDGARMIVYVDGNNIGVTRERQETIRCDHPIIRQTVLEQESPDQKDEWFSHSLGFLFCRGGDKSSVPTPSEVNPEDLARAVLRALQAHDKETNNEG